MVHNKSLGEACLRAVALTRKPGLVSVLLAMKVSGGAAFLISGEFGSGMWSGSSEPPSAQHQEQVA
jgi:hypothetical protein